MSKKPQYDPEEIRFPDQHIAACQDQIRLCFPDRQKQLLILFSIDMIMQIT